MIDANGSTAGVTMRSLCEVKERASRAIDERSRLVERLNGLPSFLYIAPEHEQAVFEVAQRILPNLEQVYPCFWGHPLDEGGMLMATPLFAVLLTGVILIVGVLTFFPVLSLGPIVEHFLMGAGSLF